MSSEQQPPREVSEETAQEQSTDVTVKERVKMFKVTVTTQPDYTGCADENVAIATQFFNFLLSEYQYQDTYELSDTKTSPHVKMLETFFTGLTLKEYVSTVVFGNSRVATCSLFRSKNIVVCFAFNRTNILDPHENVVECYHLFLGHIPLTVQKRKQK